MTLLTCRRHGGVKPLIRTCRSQARQLLEGHFEGGCAVFQAKGLDHQEPQSIYFLASWQQVSASNSQRDAPEDAIFQKYFGRYLTTIHQLDDVA